jgi:N6-L-threonylcarbamoyladenine synthase
MVEEGNFAVKYRDDLCASVQRTIVEILAGKLEKAFRQTGIREIALAGGVSANTELRRKIREQAGKFGWKVHIPRIALTTDNAAMIAITGYYRYLAGEFAGLEISPLTRMPV